MGFSDLVSCGMFRKNTETYSAHLQTRAEASTPDDYFSLALMTAFFASGLFAVPNKNTASEWPLIVFFAMTTFFLIYVPFSKISHYVYYHFTRYFLGKLMGHRGVFPRKRGGEKPAGLDNEKSLTN